MPTAMELGSPRLLKEVVNTSIGDEREGRWDEKDKDVREVKSVAANDAVDKGVDMETEVPLPWLCPGLLLMVLIGSRGEDRVSVGAGGGYCANATDADRF